MVESWEASTWATPIENDIEEHHQAALSIHAWG